MEGGAWVRNTRYGVVPEIQEIRAQEMPELMIRHGRGIYDLVAGSADLSFLNEPERMVSA